jgi:hypothetical protein
MVEFAKDGVRISTNWALQTMVFVFRNAHQSVASKGLFYTGNVL